jgi:hypothetical protein
MKKRKNITTGDTGIEFLETVRVAVSQIERLHMWNDYSDQEMRLHAGEMTKQEIRSVRAVIKAILGK